MSSCGAVCQGYDVYWEDVCALCWVSISDSGKMTPLAVRGALMRRLVSAQWLLLQYLAYMKKFDW